jgi:hypothetical protein
MRREDCYRLVDSNRAPFCVRHSFLVFLKEFHRTTPKIICPLLFVGITAPS